MTHDYGSARVNMVENQVRTNDVTDHAIQDAMGVAPRERLCPPGRDFLAYAETPVEYAPGRFLMAPRDIAKLLQAIKPRPGERALCICAPYAALLLAEIGLSVVALEPGDSLEIARKALARKTGARGLRSILEQSLIDTMFELPTISNVEKVVVDETTIEENKPPLLVYREAAKKA